MVLGRMYIFVSDMGKSVRFYRDTGNPKNNIVVFNFEVEDLKEEYEHLKAINIGEVSELMYVNVHMPYWYFNIVDPDGNILEITGEYK